MLDLRMNILNQYVEKFIIVEAAYDHKEISKKEILILKISKSLKIKLNIFL